MNPLDDLAPIACRLTAPGRAALATVGVLGPSARSIVSRLFAPVGSRSLHQRGLRSVLLGRWRESGEELVVTALRADEVEIHCHGGEASVATILVALQQQGVTVVSPHQWLHRRRGHDALQADAALALSQASTSRVARILLAQQRGALSNAVRKAGWLAAAGDRAAAEHSIREMLRWARIGLRLTHDPWRIALCGEPNVGKSTLMNRLLGYERSLVLDQPGVTRDLVTATAAFDGWPVVLCDTAGLRPSPDPLEQEGVDAARHWAAAADLVLAIVAAPQFPIASDAWHAAQHLGRQAAPQAAWIAVINQCDLLPRAAPPEMGGCWISALTGAGIEDLIRRLVAALTPEAPAEHAPVPFRDWHVEQLHSALNNLQDDRLDAALLHLQRLLDRDGEAESWCGASRSIVTARPGIASTAAARREPRPPD